MLSTFFFSICLHGIAAAVELGYEYALWIHPGYLDAKQNYQEIGGKQEHSEIAVTTYNPGAELGVVRSNPLNWYSQTSQNVQFLTRS